MQDQLFLRAWNADHATFSAGVDTLAGKLGRALKAPFRPIEHAYASLLSGLAAVGSTTALFMAVILLANLGSAGSEVPHATFALTPNVELA